MKPYLPTESNKFAKTVKVTVATGTTSQPIYLNAVQPYKLDSVSGSFSSNASGNLTIKVIRSGNEIAVFSKDLSGAGTFLVSDIGAWLRVTPKNMLTNLPVDNPGTDVVIIDNNTDQDLTAVLDFVY